VRIPLYIPYYSCPDLLEKSLESVKGIEEIHVRVINNSRSEMQWREGVTIMDTPFPLHFGPSQNWMLANAKEYGEPFWLSMHGDAEAGEGSIQRLLKTAEDATSEGRKWGVVFTNYDALAAHNTEAYSAIGGWDQNIPVYFGDVDLFRRLRLSGYETIDTDIPCIHHGSMSIKSDPRIRFISDTMTVYAHDYFLRKHGGEPGKETFSVPFNRPELFPDWKC
jgi:hypothetical protein